MSPRVGQAVVHYRLIEPLGAGGMGVVWKAEDTTDLVALLDGLPLEPRHESLLGRSAFNTVAELTKTLRRVADGVAVERSES